MQISFLGAARTVTGSMHLLEVAGRRILLDCGLFQGPRKEAFERNRRFPFDPKSIDAVVLSHAHIDHSGNLPTLVRAGFQGDIHATFATRDLCGAMLLDSAHIQESDVAYVNKRRGRQGKAPFEPLYTTPDAVRALTLFRGVGYDRAFPVTPEVTATFHDAGHILGSAITELTIQEPKKGPVTLVFTGDLGRKGMPILRDPTTLSRADLLISESTYGGRVHPADEDVEGELEEILRRTAGRGGKVIIPAFAVGRTQEVVYHLHRLCKAGRIPDMPVYVDSPLAVNVTEVFRLHPECFDEETRAFILSEEDPFGFQRLHYVRKAEASKALNQIRVPCVIVSASGMCEAGRILHHLANTVEDGRNTVLIVGFQAQGTLGRRLVDRDPVVRILGKEYQRRAEVCVLNGLSGHADRNGLLEWIGNVNGSLRHIFLVHGDPNQSEALAGTLRERKACPVTVPTPGETFTF
ncbi:MAG: MBL fold metallo-hydrolase [Candidatus Latescibacteria bacterium]|nr:MBL fold metallo-hydrolase [Candidatus Latescibacterota bacterium]